MMSRKTQHRAGGILPGVAGGLLLLASGCGTLQPPSTATAATTMQAITRQATVKIHTTVQNENFSLPWQAVRPTQGSGSGFVIRGKRLLTNAHVVSNARFIEVQKNGDSRRYPASVAFAGHDCDLAILTVDDPAFFENTQPVCFAERLPELGDTVTAVGFPLGGTRVSITRGVVSRIDYSTYAHSAVDEHLVLQVDAAINPGNSGGPILFNGRVVGVAFQGLSRGDNIGYAIPVPVIRHFLDDIADGTYHGYPELGAMTLELRNPAMREALAMPAQEDGIVIARLDPFGSAHGILQEADVLLGIDGLNIAEDGTVLFEGNAISFSELMERRQWGETIDMRVFRQGEVHHLALPLTNPPDPFLFNNLYDLRPEYVVRAGLVFVPLNREILKSQDGGFVTPHAQGLLYLATYAKLDGFHQDHDQLVILQHRLPHPVNTFADPFLQGLVTVVNGKPIRRLADLVTAFRQPLGGFHRIALAGSEDPLIIDAAAAEAAEAAILQQYGIADPMHLHGGMP